MAEGCAIEPCPRTVKARGWCNTHYERWRRGKDPAEPTAYDLTESQRFWDKVDLAGPCWLWTATQVDGGYGWFDRSLAHRWAWEHLVGPIPDGLILDHLCRVHHCVNPDHLEPVTTAVNLTRGYGISARNALKTRCKHGHEFTPENTYIHPKRGTRDCRTCRSSASQRYQEAKYLV
jgi:hypothetical protein